MDEHIPPVEAARRLRMVVAHLARRFRTAGVGAGTSRLPFSHVVVLEILDRQGALTAAEIAAVQNVRPQTAGPVLRAMEDAGLVVRTQDASDRRKQPVTLTELGREEMLAARMERERWLASAIDQHLNADEQRTLHEATLLLERIVRSTIE
ncbi:MarR family winged helix-turn-helix transcriptional regulator [Haliangium sp.]|uniref:MarR family winged helix-turn-helix transcriptional regulator n=1 Tax=Haliangium sp. TaxID=2663208 RepID=UPI003D107A9D